MVGPKKKASQQYYGDQHTVGASTLKRAPGETGHDFAKRVRDAIKQHRLGVAAQQAKKQTGLDLGAENV